MRPGIVSAVLIGGSAIAAQPANEISFHAPASASQADILPTVVDCTYTSAFASALRDPRAAAVIADAVGNSRLKPRVFLESKGERTVSVLAAEDAALWRQPPNKPSAACLTQCFLLPEYARATRVILSAADGQARCALLPSNSHPRFEAASIDCGDGSYWRDVVAHPVQSNWVVCATVLNTRTNSTHHMMTVSYEYRHVQTDVLIR